MSSRKNRDKLSYLAVRTLRSQANKLKFALGLTPKIEKSSLDYRKFIPEPYKAVCLISADFEMAWASRYTKSVENPLQKAIEDGLRTRRNIPIILDLCDKYDIPITWATVGHLFLESCQQINDVKHPEIPRLPYFENEFWKFDKGDWFDYDPCTDYIRDPAWYAPDLIKDILSRKTKHEIGCHTFSHVDCRDGIDDGGVFEAEIVKCQDIAQEWGFELKSFVHPGHTIGHLTNLVKFSFRNFRSDRGDALCYPIFHPEGIWEFRNTMHLERRKEWSIKYHISRYKTIIDRAIKTGTVCNIWFHPQIRDEQFVRQVFDSVFKHLNKRRMEIVAMTMREYCTYMESMLQVSL